MPVHRADSSGPGWDLDKYLIATSTNWVSEDRHVEGVHVMAVAGFRRG